VETILFSLILSSDQPSEETSTTSSIGSIFSLLYFKVIASNHSLKTSVRLFQLISKFKKNSFSSLDKILFQINFLIHSEKDEAFKFHFLNKSFKKTVSSSSKESCGINLIKLENTTDSFCVFKFSKYTLSSSFNSSSFFSKSFCDFICLIKNHTLILSRVLGVSSSTELFSSSNSL
jgi:hypothetical protein